MQITTALHTDNTVAVSLACILHLSRKSKNEATKGQQRPYYWEKEKKKKVSTEKIFSLFLKAWRHCTYDKQRGWSVPPPLLDKAPCVVRNQDMYKGKHLTLSFVAALLWGALSCGVTVLEQTSFWTLFTIRDANFRLLLMHYVSGM